MPPVSAEAPVAVPTTRWTSATFRFIMGWLGRKKNYVQSYTLNGEKFKPYPVSSMIPDWSAILWGCKNVTGYLWRKEEGGQVFRSWNSYELKGKLVASGPNDPLLDNLRRYQGPLRDDPKTWPEVYRKVWFETRKA